MTGGFFLTGLWDCVSLWNLRQSRTLRNMTLRALPLYTSGLVLAVAFSWVPTTFGWSAFWMIGWGLPSYLVGGFLQLCFSHQITSIQSNPIRNSRRSITFTIAEGVYGILLSLSFLAQTYLFHWITVNLSPSFMSAFLSTAVNVLMIAWATAFSAFEPQLISKGWCLTQRIAFLETHWEYALGYGLVAGIAYNLAPAVFATGLWQFLQLLLTLRMTLISLRQKTAGRIHAERLRIFQVPEYFTSQIILQLDSLFRFTFVVAK